MLYKHRYLILYLVLTCMSLIAALLFCSDVFADTNDAKQPEAKIIQQSLGRDFGVLVGDRIEHHYIIEVPETFSLSPASLPIKGDLNYWLRLVSVNYHPLAVLNKHKRYQIDLVFQTFYAPLDVRVLFTPEMMISFYHGDAEIKLSLPKWPFSMSPLKESSAAGGEARSFMKPDLPVLAIDTDNLRMQVYGLSAAVLIMTILWLMLTGRLFHAVPSPFQQTIRQIKRLQKKQGQAGIERAIQLVHQAFNTQAQFAVFSHKIDEFIRIYPEFSANRHGIDDFYHLSAAVLYGQQKVSQDHYVLLLELCRSMARSEKLALKK